MNKTLTATVESVREKTAKVSVSRVIRHKKYFKELKVRKNYLVHNEVADIGVGDIVEIVEGRPISKNKSFKISKIIKKNDSEIY